MLAVILCTGNHFDFFLPLAMTSKLLIGGQAIRSVNIFHFFSVVFVFYGVSLDDFLGGMRVQTSEFAFLLTLIFLFLC